MAGQCGEDWERQPDFPNKEASLVLEMMASITNGAILNAE